MAADGLLKREPAPNDRRRRVLTLTESGREMLDSVNQVRGRRCHSMLKGFTDVELQRRNIVLSTLADTWPTALPAFRCFPVTKRSRSNNVELRKRFCVSGFEHGVFEEATASFLSVGQIDDT